MESATFCFTCGQPVTTPPRLNDLPDGEPCPTCRERALDVVAPALPRRREAAPQADAAERQGEDDTELLPSWRASEVSWRSSDHDPEPA